MIIPLLRIALYSKYFLYLIVEIVKSREHMFPYVPLRGSRASGKGFECSAGIPSVGS